MEVIANRGTDKLTEQVAAPVSRCATLNGKSLEFPRRPSSKFTLNATTLKRSTIPSISKTTELLVFFFQPSLHVNVNQRHGR